MSSSLALSGNDTFVAKVISEDSPYKSRSRDTKTLSGVGGRRVWGKRTVSLLAILLLFLGVTLSFFAQSQRNAEANWFTNAVRGVFCSTPAYFNEPVGWQNGFSAMVYGSAGAAVGVLTQDGDPGFLDSRRTADEQFGSGGAKWTVYAGENEDSPYANISGRVAIKEEEDKDDEDEGDKKVYTDQRVQTYYDTCIPVGALVSTAVANGIHGITAFLTDVSGWVISQAYDPQWVNSLNDVSARVITGEDENGQSTGNGLRDALYLEFLNLVIFMSAIWLFYTGVAKRKTTEALSGAAYMVGAVIAGSLLVYNPSLLPNVTNDITSQVSSAVLVGTASATSPSADNKAKNNLCYSEGPGPVTNYKRGTLANEGKSVREYEIELRRDFIITGANCQLWRAFVYEPWVVGQFGVSSSQLDNFTAGEGITIPEVDLGGNTPVQNLALYQMSTQVMTSAEMGANKADSLSVYSQNMMDWYTVVDAVASPEGDTSYYTAWAGQDGSSRIGIATAALVAAGFGLFIVSILAMGMLAYSVAAAILMFVSVFFFLLGAHPGIGRRLAMRWFEMYVGAILKKIILAVMLSMMIAFYSAILSQSNSNWGTSVMAIIAISVAILMYRKELLNTIGSSVDFGGAGLSTEPTERAGKMAKGLVGGVAIGGVMGAAAGGKIGAGIMKSGAGTARSRVAAATRATARGTVAGAGRMGSRTALAGGGGGGGLLGGAILTHGQMGAGAGRSSAQKTADKHTSQDEQARARQEARVQQEKQEEYAQAMEEWRKTQSANNLAYMDAYQQHKNDPAWRKHIKQKYGLKHIPDPQKEMFNGYGKDPKMWKKDDAPRPYIQPTFNDTVPGPDNAGAPAGPPVSPGNPVGPLNQENLNDMMGGENSGSTSSGAGDRPDVLDFTQERLRDMMGDNNSGSQQPPPSTPGPRPTPPPAGSKPVYTSEAERRINEAEDKEIAKRRQNILNNNPNALPRRNNTQGGNNGNGGQRPPSRPQPPKR